MDSGAPVMPRRRSSAGSTSLPKLSRRRRARLGRRPLVRVISGGQTGVDRAALDAALEAGLPVGGWCPRGRKAEDGAVPDRYPMHETPSSAYAERTRWNVRDSDATLILSAGPLTGGTALTLTAVRSTKQPHCVVDSRTHSPQAAAALVDEWLESTGAEVLNIAGPRESSAPGIYTWALATLQLVLAGRQC